MAVFGDQVRIKLTGETEQLGLAGREGVVFGFTTPSITGVEVIGSPRDDYALNVNFDDTNENFWFSDDLVEFVDVGAGQVMRLDGVEQEWVRLPNGEWEQRPLGKN